MKSSQTSEQQKIVDYRKQLLDGPASACVMIVYLYVFIHVRLCWLVWLCVLLSGHSKKKIGFTENTELLQNEKRMWNSETATWRGEKRQSGKEILGRSSAFEWDERLCWFGFHWGLIRFSLYICDFIWRKLGSSIAKPWKNFLSKLNF